MKFEYFIIVEHEQNLHFPALIKILFINMNVKNLLESTVFYVKANQMQRYFIGENFHYPTIQLYWVVLNNSPTYDES